MSIFKLKDYNTEDTIAAIATFPASSALGVIKISGNKAIDIVDKIFFAKSRISLKNAKTYTLHYGWIINGKSNKLNKKNIVDEVLVSIMRKPHSYTREDVVEISSHGGLLVLNKILKLLLKGGARLALRGEFTYRAFINGRIDLLKAMSILDIVNAKTENALMAATSQLKGSISERFSDIKEELKNIFIQTEASINFLEEEDVISTAKIKESIKVIRNKINKILKEIDDAKVLRDGIRCVICGKTNVGKSTLFNSILGEERAIVSEIPATTRDVIEQVISISGMPFKFYDTAGILKTKDVITTEAVKKTYEILKEAEIIILTLDFSKALDEDDYFLLEKVKEVSNEKKVIVVINKIDLKQKLFFKKPMGFDSIVRVSALKNIGIEELKRTIVRSVYKKKFQNCIFLSQYQSQILAKIEKLLNEAIKYLNQKQPIDFVNFLLKEILEEFGKLTGEVFCEEVLESIFSNFCIGK